jgi:hypothetical protein
VDLAFWLTGFLEIEHVSSRMHCGGRSLSDRSAEVEDFAVAELSLAGSTSVRLACSWRLHAGCDAVIETTVFGTQGGASIRNVGGSFYDFELLHHRGTASERLVSPPDDWGARAALAWAERVARDPSFDEEALKLTAVSSAGDRIYAAADVTPFAFSRAGLEKICD